MFVYGTLAGIPKNENKSRAIEICIICYVSYLDWDERFKV